MAPRPRTRSAKLPANLCAEPQGGTVYYRYRNPVNGRRTSLGTDAEKAIKAAIALNAHLAHQLMDRESERLVSRVMTDRQSIGDFLKTFETEILPGRRSKKGHALAEKTLREYSIMLRTIRIEFGHLSWEVVTLERVSAFLDRLLARSSNAHRSLMIQIWRHAIAKGKIIPPTNVPEMTIPRDHVVKRRPLTLEDFQQIHHAANKWFRNALDLALHTLQRREDIVQFRFDSLEERDGRTYLPVRQLKTDHTSDMGRLLLPVGPALDTVIARCRDDILSPYLVHKAPARRRREYLDKKEHWTAVTPEMLTREFTRLRDQTQVSARLTPEQRPTFHEIRALGAELYRQAGWANEAIQRLLGHSTEKMTKHYLDKHMEAWVVTDTVGLPSMVSRK
ncbi:phage integrase Arm DNA-binding domain-containing protein [Acidithiobacillus ferriphilus]|uniref:phage integrase Arm DNA-binding domain-containing protein n=1 Tax=Acidithiobacillus ferriphilus TaxID=1689834 RepID=UPI0002188638|nr:phage integrase Arm DNA-binding domain-containing protein [Acidithiobacillus ferriphilus]EGQ62984.1 phage integrase, putative [Acidithiobacillus sp. GGI-221]MBU2830193.1 tyrosine-type recombinase/integrase [Acidithiobacillus ferriphilus]